MILAKTLVIAPIVAILRVTQILIIVAVLRLLYQLELNIVSLIFVLIICYPIYAIEEILVKNCFFSPYRRMKRLAFVFIGKKYRTLAIFWRKT